MRPSFFPIPTTCTVLYCTVDLRDKERIDHNSVVTINCTCDREGCQSSMLELLQLSSPPELERACNSARTTQQGKFAPDISSSPRISSGPNPCGRTVIGGDKESVIPRYLYLLISRSCGLPYLPQSAGLRIAAAVVLSPNGELDDAHGRNDRQKYQRPLSPHLTRKSRIRKRRRAPHSTCGVYAVLI